jgi:hypothetical protein
MIKINKIKKIMLVAIFTDSLKLDRCKTQKLPIVIKVKMMNEIGDL